MIFPVIFPPCDLPQVCRQRRIPVIFDEVFTGCWRLGAPTGGAILGLKPDIACYAKLLTAGVAPLAVTLATEEVFKAFQSHRKVRGWAEECDVICLAGYCAAVFARRVSMFPECLCAPEAVPLPWRLQDG